MGRQRLIVLALGVAACWVGGGSAATTPPCRTVDLGARVSWQGATGSLLGGVSLVNRGRTACTLPPRPAVAVLAGTRRLAVTETPFRGVGPGRLLRTLRPNATGATAFSYLQWTNWCGAPPRRLRLEIRLPGTRGRLLATLPAGTPRCDVQRGPSTLGVSRFRDVP